MSGRNRGIECHITIGGTPFCEHPASNPNHPSFVGIGCGHDSLRSAERMKRELQKKWFSVKVVRGECPAMAEAFKRLEERREVDNG